MLITHYEFIIFSFYVIFKAANFKAVVILFHFYFGGQLKRKSGTFKVINTHYKIHPLKQLMTAFLANNG